MIPTSPCKWTTTINHRFAEGTLGIAKLLANLTEQGVNTVVGGGDSVAAIEQMKYADRVTHVSTGR